ncbi:MAG: Uma2 family endonuclease [Methylococcales bacterium]|jgi:Uma2 family endonuclease|nr:Uma2 family endonuclease [Methylococcales bacterium]MBT7409342.1 Uma2 family endonuclease [Methylococcales bacterium]
MALPELIQQVVSEQDYLDGEMASDIKHEYIGGKVFAMAGASESHNLISGNIFRKLGNHLEQQKSICKIFSSDMKVQVASSDQNYFYPDVMVVCDSDDNESEYYKKSPVLIVEVLSKSTIRQDTTTKMMAYINIPTLQEYVMIAQDSCRIEVLRKNEHWKPAYYYLGDDIAFESLNITLTVSEIYYQIENEDMLEYMEG